MRILQLNTSLTFNCALLYAQTSNQFTRVCRLRLIAGQQPRRQEVNYFANVVLMLGQRRSRSATIKTTPYVCREYSTVMNLDNMYTLYQAILSLFPTYLCLSTSSVAEVGQHWFNDFCFLLPSRHNSGVSPGLHLSFNAGAVA